MSVSQKDGIIAWFAKNPVAANLLMAVILCVGLASAFKIQRAMFPAFDIEALFIEMFYPGAPPEEVEKGLVYRIEDAINAVKAAIDEGVVTGGGSCLLHCIKGLNNNMPKDLTGPTLPNL